MSGPSARQRLIAMFDDMMLRKDSSAVARHYHPDFVLETNGQRQDYRAFEKGHRKVYATDVTYAVRYDDDAWVDSPDRVAGRLWIITQRPGEAAVTFEVILVATLRDGRCHRLWELTRPDWTREKAFADY